MRTTIRSTMLSMILAGTSALAFAACNRGADEPDDTPIVIEESEPIALGEPSEPTEDEVEFADEPQVITRTVVVRERPAPSAPRPVEPREEEPARPARPSSIPAGTAIPVSLLTEIDSQNDDVGATWTGRVTRDVVVNGFVVIPGGSTVTGVVTAIDEGDPDGVGSITLDARSVETVSGTSPLEGEPVGVGETFEDGGFPTRETAIGAGAGAVLGGIVGGKKGALIGAAAGGAGGAAMGTARNDYEVRAAAGTGFTIRVESPISI